MNEIKLEDRIIITTKEGYSFEVANREGKLEVSGVSGLVAGNDGMFDYSVKITHMAQFEKGLTPNQIREKIKP